MPICSNSKKTIGIVLIGVGFVFLIGYIAGLDPWSGHPFWPLFIIIPGEFLLPGVLIAAGGVPLRRQTKQHTHNRARHIS